MNPQVRTIAELDRVIHEPGRLSLTPAGRLAFEQYRRKVKEAL
jgi:hypothetical protein